MIDNKRNSTGSSRTALLVVAACLALPGLALAQAAMRQRAGEWVTQMENGRARRVCLHEDQVMDKATLMRKLGSIPGAKCTIDDMQPGIASVSYVATCVVNGTMHMTTHETVTMVGPDAFVTKSVVRMDKGPMNGMTNSLSSHRTGPCQPGDLKY